MDFEIAKFINHLGAGTIGALTAPISSLVFLVLFFCAILLIALLFNKKNSRVIFVSFIIALALHFLISELFFKYILADFMPLRLRPYLAHPGEITPIGRLNADSSFPSSHMSSTLALLAVYIYYYRKSWPFAAAFALIMGFSRIYNGMHYPSDVVAGAVLGILYGLAAVSVAPVFLALKRKGKAALLFIGLLIVFLGYSYAIEPNRLKIKSRSFKLDCLTENGLGNDKFVQISDLHFTGRTRESKIDQIYGAIKNINPKAVFITGDFISDRDGVEPAVKLVKKITETSKVYAVFGNWDYWALDFKISDLKDELESSGAEVLVNNAAVIKVSGETINILGVNDPYTSGNPKNDLEKTFKKIEGGGASCNLLLAHSPEIIPLAAAKDIDLVLVGHTHGGQVYLPFITGKIIPVGAEGKEYVRGFYQAGKTQVYINRGIGTSGLPLRFLASPEITEIQLK